MKNTFRFRRTFVEESLYRPIATPSTYPLSVSVSVSSVSNYRIYRAFFLHTGTCLVDFAVSSNYSEMRICIQFIECGIFLLKTENNLWFIMHIKPESRKR